MFDSAYYTVYLGSTLVGQRRSSDTPNRRSIVHSPAGYEGTYTLTYELTYGQGMSQGIVHSQAQPGGVCVCSDAHLGAEGSARRGGGGGGVERGQPVGVLVKDVEHPAVRVGVQPLQRLRGHPRGQVEARACRLHQ
eukprot:2057010-Pyramimonas_sp.AAC.1